MIANGRIQLHPFARIAAMLILGIAVGDALCSGVWMKVFVAVSVLLVVCSMGLWRKPVAQTISLLALVFVLGAWWMGLYKTRHQKVLPEERIAYKAVVMSRPVLKAKSVACDLLVVGGRYDGYMLKVAFWRNGNDEAEGLRVGDGMAVNSKMKAPSDFPGSGNFSYKRWMLTHGFSANTIIYDGRWNREVVSLKDVSRLVRMRLTALMMREKWLERLSESGVEGTSMAVISAMTLGDKSLLTADLKDVYSVSGVSHLLALSGLHLGIIYVLLSLLFLRPGRRSVLGQSVILLAIWTYVLMVGMPPSVVRAAVMITVYALCSMLGRRRLSLNALSLTAVVMLVVNPYCLWDVGFQMSFVSVFFIFVFYSPIYRLVSRERLLSCRFLNWVWSMIAVSVSAQIGVAPLVAYYFGRFSCYFLLANIVAIPLATVVIYATLALFCLSFNAFAARLVADGVMFVTDLLNNVLAYMAQLPGASIDGIRLNSIQLLLIYVLIACMYVIGGYAYRMYCSANYRLK